MLQQRLRHPGEAARSARRALELNPNFALAHALLAIALAIQAAHQEAVDSAEHALRLSPRDRPVGLYASMAMMNVHFTAAVQLKLQYESVEWFADLAKLDGTTTDANDFQALSGNNQLVEAVSSTEVTVFVPRSDVVDLALGVKLNLVGTLVGFASAIVPVTSDGLRADVIPPAGFEWSFLPAT